MLIPPEMTFPVVPDANFSPAYHWLPKMVEFLQNCLPLHMVSIVSMGSNIFWVLISIVSIISIVSRLSEARPNPEKQLMENEMVLFCKTNQSGNLNV